MTIKGHWAYISRYEVISAFLRTEEEGDEAMANQLNELINMFCKAEVKQRSNVPVLPFDKRKYAEAIAYIEA